MDKEEGKSLTDEQVSEMVKLSKAYMRKLIDDMKDSKTDPRIVVPAVMAMYSRMTFAMGMDIDESIRFAVQSIGEAYGVNVVQTTPEEVEEMRGMFDGSDKVH